MLFFQYDEKFLAIEPYNEFSNCFPLPTAGPRINKQGLADRKDFFWNLPALETLGEYIFCTGFIISLKNLVQKASIL